MGFLKKVPDFLFDERPIFNLLGACASGIFFGYLMEHTVDSGYFSQSTFIKFVVLAAGSYILAALFFYRSTRGANNAIPRWLLITVLGSVISSITGFLGAKWVYIYGYVMNWDTSNIVNAVSENIISAIFFLIFDTLLGCFVALPIMFLSHLVGFLLHHILAIRKGNP